MSDNIEKRVIELRKKGYSRNEISAILHIGHSKVQDILNRYNLTAKKGIDYRKKEYKGIVKKKKRIKVKRVKYKKKRVIYKKKEKKKIGKVKEKIGKVKKEKGVRKKYRYFIYAFIVYRGYKKLYLEKGKFGTKYFEYYDRLEKQDALENARFEALHQMNGICQSLSSIKFFVYYINVTYDVINEKVIDRRAISNETYTCDDLRGLTW